MRGDAMLTAFGRSLIETTSLLGHEKFHELLDGCCF
jgi:hypothetical protein